MVRPECFTALEGVNVIFHAGDVGGREVISVLSRIAPVQAVFGNTDIPGDPSLALHFCETIDGVTVHVSHGHELGAPTPEKLLARYDADVIVYGHTHRPLILWEGQRLVINPGAAGPRRFSFLPSVARLTIRDGRADATLIELG
jgi:putative phosphoesterase